MAGGRLRQLNTLCNSVVVALGEGGVLWWCSSTTLAGDVVFSTDAAACTVESLDESETAVVECTRVPLFLLLGILSSGILPIRAGGGKKLPRLSGWTCCWSAGSVSCCHVVVPIPIATRYMHRIVAVVPAKAADMDGAAERGARCRNVHVSYNCWGNLQIAGSAAETVAADCLWSLD